MKRPFYYMLACFWCLLLGAGLWLRQPQITTPSAFTGNGYGGPIHMNMALTREGTISSIEITEHHETIPYISQLGNFLHQFIGRSRQSPLILGRDIDAISGATITSQAITKAVRKKRSNILNINPEQETPDAIDLKHIFIPLCLTLAAIMAFVFRYNPLRWAILIGATVYFGIINHTMLSIIQITESVLGHIPSFTQNTLGWMLLGIAFISAVLIGRIYCGNLCPFASIQEILFQLKVHHETPSIITPAIDKNSRIIKYVLLLTITGLAFYLNSSAVANIEPFVTLFAGHGGKLAWSLLALMLVLAVFNFRFWCKYLCPVGALTSLVAVFSFFKIRSTRACTSCGTCTRICPTQAITLDKKGIPAIDTAECIACAKCLRTCPAKALKIQGPSHEQA